jgi:hypothetical protein
LTRGNITGQDRVTLQVLQQAKRPDGSVEPHWVDVLDLRAKVIPLSAEVRTEFQQRGMTVSHKLRLDAAPTWTPLKGAGSKDRGRLWPGLVRFAYVDRAGLTRVLTYQGSYDPMEAGRMLTVMAQEDTAEQQFPH